MSQAKVTEFFSSRKPRTNASKRRKISVPATDQAIKEHTSVIPVADSTKMRVPEIIARNTETKAQIPETYHTFKVNNTIAPRRSSRSVIKSVARSPKLTRSAQKKVKAISSSKINPIEEAFKKIKATIDTSTLGLGCPNETKCTEAITSTGSTKEIAYTNQLQCVITHSDGHQEEVTSSWDDHDAAAKNRVTTTPTKTLRLNSSSMPERKRKRQLKNSIEQSEVQAKTPTKSHAIETTSELAVKEHTSGRKKKLFLSEVSEGTNRLKGTVATEISEETCNSPVMQRSRTKATQSESSKLMDALQTCKALSKGSLMVNNKKVLDCVEVKSRLEKCGKLEELKAQLSLLNQNKAKAKKEAVTPKPEPKLDTVAGESQQESSNESKKPAPAYERYHHLITAEAPTLGLPYKYRLLLDMFRGMDTVVSILHNRHEICTFTKLKFAVQEMVKRNFELKSLCQIKHVYPSAYTFKQEKGIPMFGNKSSDYQLTIEPHLLQDKSTSVDVQLGRVHFSASHILQRKNHFHHTLVNAVKKYHKDFLSNLDRPLLVPDDKITRWHPKFPLDEVPDVECASLPESPAVVKYQTAKDVLQVSRGNVIPRVQAALEKVAFSSSNNCDKNNTNTENTPTTPKSKVTDNVALKGVPQSLLDKIRAKEASKLEALLTRKPGEEKRTLMLKRLPDMMRIVRNYYITEKKPALLYEAVNRKLGESYRTFIAVADVEKHISLMLEICPDWLTEVKIKAGRYLKMDRTIELQKLEDRINNIVKSSQ